jgi:Rod binding domain-containing protein
MAVDLLSVHDPIYPDKVTASLPTHRIVGSNSTDSEDSKMLNDLSTVPTSQGDTILNRINPDLWRLSKSLESTFLSEMLSKGGLGKTNDSFGGGIGEEQFSSFLNQQRAIAMVEKGGIGLAESIYKSLIDREA